jgi:hypothetical protein
MPELAIAFCILADLLATLPTLRKAYGAPNSEYAPPYLLSVLAMLITLGTVVDGGFTAHGFPLYMLSINVVLFAFATLPLARIARRAAVPGRHGIPRGYRAGATAGAVARSVRSHPFAGHVPTAGAVNGR